MQWWFRAVRSTKARIFILARTTQEDNGAPDCDTIRPVKKYDAAGSLKLSAEYVGAVRENSTMSSNGSGSSGEGALPGKKRRTNENARAGRAMIDEVVVPVVQNVSSFPCFAAYFDLS